MVIRVVNGFTLDGGGKGGMQFSIPPSHTRAMLFFISSAYFAANVVKQYGTETLAIYRSNFIRRFAVVEEQRSIAVILQLVILDGIVQAITAA